MKIIIIIELCKSVYIELFVSELSRAFNFRYVVKTLDNAESVKLQYRSLAKVPDDGTAKPLSTILTPNWL